ncbi:MAG: alpha/beta hydrolase [Pseudomonadota bacterium]
MAFFEGFSTVILTLPDGDQRVRYGGSGPAIVLIHGNPQTHVMWHAVAPKLAEQFTVICPDLRGYGMSPKPPASAESAAYSKRAMAADICRVMDHFGHAEFAILAHDRGARAAHRLALDQPSRVTRLALLDIIPTLEHFERTDMEFALAYAHWFYLAMRAPFPEDMINGDPEAWFMHHCDRPVPPSELFHPDALADYLTHIRDPLVVQGICEDYRAAKGIDLDHDRASRAAGEKIECPLLALWGAKGIIGKFYDPLAIWRDYASGPVSGGAINAGHYLAEEAPDEVLAQLVPFLATVA